LVDGKGDVLSSVLSLRPGELVRKGGGHPMRIVSIYGGTAVCAPIITTPERESWPEKVTELERI